MLRTLVTDKIAEEGLRVLRQGSEVEYRPGASPDELRDLIGDFAALVVRSRTKVTAQVIQAADELLVIGRAGVGVDNIDLRAATERGIIVVNSPSGNTLAVAEHTSGMLLALARRLPHAHFSITRGEWNRSEFMGRQVYGKVLGIVGLGRIGTEVAKRAQALGMAVVGIDPIMSAERARNLHIELVDLPELLERADFVTLHVPLNEQTHHLIDAEGLRRMKPTAYLINCARGGVVDDAALVEALDHRTIAGAALDVFEQEPPVDQRLLTHPKVILTPHIGASTAEAQVDVAVDVAEQVVDVLEGRPPRSPVNLPALSREMLTRLRPYLTLATRLGALQAQLAPGRIEEVELTYIGEMLEQDTSPFTRGFLCGLLQVVMGGSVNFVNAPVVAESRGIRLRETRRHSSGDYSNLIRTRVVTPKGEREINGSVFEGRDLRIVGIDGYRIDLVPEGHLVIIRNIDQPGTIGRVGTMLGNAGINIAGMQMGRAKTGDDAVMALSVDSPVPDEVIGELRGLPNVTEVWQVSFGMLRAGYRADVGYTSYTANGNRA